MFFENLRLDYYYYIIVKLYLNLYVMFVLFSSLFTRDSLILLSKYVVTYETYEVKAHNILYFHFTDM